MNSVNAKVPTKGKKAKPDLGDVNLDDLLLGGLGGGSGGGLGKLLDQPDKLEADDPLGHIDYENITNEEAVKQETSAVLEAFKARAKKEQERFALATDTEYWVGLCFQTREQKEVFLRAVGLLQAGDKYIDGRLLAKRMGVELPDANVPYNVSARPDAKFAAMVLDQP